MPDQSELDRKYFIDGRVYNCPFCNRRNVLYTVETTLAFEWDDEDTRHLTIISCQSCRKRSLHLSKTEVFYRSDGYQVYADYTEDIDSHIFYSVPTSFFTIDKRIPKIIRELVTEAEGSLKMNFLTGASSCARKAIYELLVKEEIEGTEYEERIKALKTKYPSIDPAMFDILAHIQDMTSEKVHEQSWEKWDANNLKLILEALKAVLHEIYVVPDEKAQRAKDVLQLREKIFNKKKPEATKATPAT
ncbi:MAG: hypothetical protein WCX61_00335 [Candidatus Peribacteraceae bacterium]|jgi:transcription elongation factor Elf1